MTPEERNRLAEQWLETALKPRTPEPRLGLESRILAAIEAEKSVSRFPSPVSRFALRVPRFAWPMAAAAVFIAVLGLALRWSYGPQIHGGANGTVARQAVPALPSADRGASAIVAGQAPHTPILRSAQDGALSSVPRPSAVEAAVHDGLASARLKPRPSERAVQQRATLKQRESPRLEQFPAPRPLSEQERLLLAYLRTTPREEILLVALRQAEDELRRQEQFRNDLSTAASSAASADRITEEN